jgi:hypothetical protein
MVRVEGCTYRVVRKQSRSYAIVRILDDLEVGTFQTGPLRVCATLIAEQLLYEIAVMAIRQAKTSMVSNMMAPQAEQAAPRFRPSSQPPPNAVPA